MIIIVTSSAREATALKAIADEHQRPVCTCGSLANLRARLRTAVPAVIITRVRLSDGYSDDVLSLLRGKELLPGTKVAVLGDADFTSRQEARQLSLGADCILRDPLRTEVLTEYLAKFLRAPVASRAPVTRVQSFVLSGATVHFDQQQVQAVGRSVHISPKEIELARLLAESDGHVLTYDTLYDELFNRAFHGDSANLRVLLGKLVGTYRRLGIDLRASIRVTPKLGYTCIKPVTRRPPTRRRRRR